MIRVRPLLFALLPLAVAACGGEGDEATDTPTAAAAQDEAVTLRFEAVVGDEAFACGQSYDGIGATGTTWTPWDLRLYVHDVTLLDDAGHEAALTLDDDGVWQAEGVALLDFEDKTGACTGTPETRTTVTGTAPAGDWTGVRFTVGVPFDLNHQDPTLAPSPLNITSMGWSWAAGYKFIRIDGASTGMPGGLFFHLGSAGCEVDDAQEVSGCDAPNRPTLTVTGLDLDAGAVTLDVAALYAGVDLDANTDGTAPGCMSQPTDPECAPSFAHLGLDFGGVSGDPSAQSVFSAD